MSTVEPWWCDVERAANDGHQNEKRMENKMNSRYNG